MKRCRTCKVPLEGMLGKVANTLFKVAPSAKDATLCNKCGRVATRTYHCQICDRDVDEHSALTHAKTEEYLIGLIAKDHPQWKKGAGLCQECLEYYRRLVKEAKI